ncbi:uncharacterized protein P884DRAFT_294443 [Thermothelomyces heterothallicus CBS 202.75]|uniref:uncharacterized protein n=1 Tax=Thermothelomyces heterothallicus CBS 202.75 TaxID=1149848 RepID=UPI003744B1FA
MCTLNVVEYAKTGEGLFNSGLLCEKAREDIRFYKAKYKDKYRQIMAGGSRKSMTKRGLPQKPTLGIYVRVCVRSLWPKWMAGDDGLWKEQNPGSLGTYCAAFPRDAPVSVRT